MKHKLIALLLLAGVVGAAAQTPYVTAGRGCFWRGDSVYSLTGTNMWYGPVLASEGRGGDRDRLARELDMMQQCGINNVRVVAGGDGREGLQAHIMPVLQTAPGVYNDTLLDGLDFFLAELERRDMTAVIYLNNAWEWSGGYSTYLQWATGQEQPIPAADGYQTYVDAMAAFVKNDVAMALVDNHIRNIVTRRNRYTGKPYAESPAIMAWQIANEPRPFARDSVTLRAFERWIAREAALIKSLDANHMVSTGSEGSVGCEGSIDLWQRMHSDPNVDYAVVHVWPANWGWVNAQTLTDSIDAACRNTRQYVLDHVERIAPTGKPLVIEEFGYPRDGRRFEPSAPVTARNEYFRFVFELAERTPGIAGTNFWPWGGDVVPPHAEAWQPWDPYTGDPAQEPQGLYSVFAADRSTLDIVSRHALAIRAKFQSPK